MRLEQRVDPSHTALVVIDLQNDFCHPKGVFSQLGLDRTGIDDAVSQVQSLIASARARSVPVVFVRSSHSEWTISPVLADRVEHWRSPRWCIEGSWGSELYQLQSEPQDHIVRRHRYSGFLGTDLELVLRARGIKTVVVVGYMTDICVETTVRDGFMRDFYVVVPSDCCASNSKAAHEFALERIGAYFGVVATSAEIDAAWSAQARA